MLGHLRRRLPSAFLGRPAHSEWRLPDPCPVMPFNARVCLAGLENTLRGNIRIDHHMKVGGSDMEGGQTPSFLRAKPHDGVPYSPPVLIPAQLESGFDHRFANMLLKTRL